MSRILFYGTILLGAWWWMLRMPGRSAEGPLPPLSEGESRLASQLHRDLQALAADIGERLTPRSPSLIASATASAATSKRSYAAPPAPMRSWRWERTMIRSLAAPAQTIMPAA